MIEIDEEMAGRVNGAIDQQRVLTVAYVDTRGRPHASFYGSLHVYGPDQLALWVRNPAGELVRTIGDRPHVVAVYGDIGSRVYYTFEGRAGLSEDPQVRTRVYEGMHALEQQFDPDRGGVPVLVDLDRVVTLSVKGKVEMVR